MLVSGQDLMKPDAILSQSQNMAAVMVCGNIRVHSIEAEWSSKHICGWSLPDLVDISD